MKYIVKPNTMDIDSYITRDIKSFLLPIDGYSSDYEKTFSIDEIKKFSEYDVFVVMNKIVFNEDIDKIRSILLELDKFVKGIFFYDLAYIEIKKELNLNLELVWNQTHMVTNYKTCDFYLNRGVSYGVLSSDITLEEMIEIKNKSNMKFFVNYFGHIVVANSRRKLLSNYLEYNKLEDIDTLNIVEPVSKQEYYLFENNGGTSFKTKKILNGFSLDIDFDYAILNEEGIEHDSFVNIVLSFDKDKISEYFDDYDGFFFTKTIFKVKKEK